MGTHGSFYRVLIGGFVLVMVLLLAAGIVGMQNVRSINENVAALLNQELVQTRLIEEIQREQAALAAVFYKLSRDPQFVDREKILSELDEADDRIDQIVTSVAGTPEAETWNDLQTASSAFSDEARRLLSTEKPTTLLSRDLFRRHEETLSLMAKLAAASYKDAAEARAQIDQRSHVLMRHSFLLLGACVLLALAGAVVTVRMASRLFRRMEWQTSELSRVSWHMLEDQETTARRFSHELHDELGQSLTALKMNLAALRPGDERIEDCVNLVEESIRNVRELSQLLHPTILDDFGLDAALRWLTERFTQRSGIEVEYESNLKARLGEDVERHLFRICQEALTNVARHSGATRVEVELKAEGDRLTLSVADNGKGIPSLESVERDGLGLIGMRARARSAGGELRIRSAEGKGLRIEARVEDVKKSSSVARG